VTAATGTGLGWVTFTAAGNDKPCTWVKPHQCPSQALYVVIFEVVSGECPHRRRLYCLAHKDLMVASRLLLNGEFSCYLCDDKARVRLVSIEPLPLG
jgi:hypothetical protein